MVKEQFGKKGNLTASSTDLGSKRLAKKLESLYEQLVTIGFQERNVEQALSVCTLRSGESLSLEGVLDWLCLHLGPEELPAQFADPSTQELKNTRGNLGVGHAGAVVSEEERLARIAARQEQADDPKYRALRREDIVSEQVEESHDGHVKQWILQYSKRESEAEIARKTEARPQNSAKERWDALPPEEQLALLKDSYEEEKLKAKEAKDSGRMGRREKAEMEARLKDIREQMSELNIVVGQRRREMKTLKEGWQSNGSGRDTDRGETGGGRGALKGKKEQEESTDLDECLTGMFGDEEDEEEMEDKGVDRSSLSGPGSSTQALAKHKEITERSVLGGLFGDDDDSDDTDGSEGAQKGRFSPSTRSSLPPRETAEDSLPALCSLAPPSPDRAIPGVAVEASSKTAPPSTPQPQSVAPDSSPAPALAVSLAAGIPKGWTGKTPRRQLEEYLKRKRLGKATFQKTSGKGCVLTLRDISGKFESVQEFGAYADAEHAAATRALYRLEPKLQLSRVLPPPFRDWWAEWQNEARRLREQEVAAVKQGKRDRISRLVDSMREGAALSAGEERTGDVRQGGDHCHVRDSPGVLALPSMSDMSWEEQVCLDEGLVEAEGGERGAPTRGTGSQREKTGGPRGDTALGERLRKAFEAKRGQARYQELARVRRELPVAATRESILHSIEKESVVVISGETGCGKSTQVAQYILEEALLLGEGHNVNLVCTQPRRVAAVSLAERVAQEMGEEGGAGGSGALVGYQIRMESKTTAATRLTFCTTGILLRKLQTDPDLSQYTHIILDEVHERQALGDFLLVVLRDLLKRRPTLRLVLMSATVNADLFSWYFGNCPVFTIPGRCFSVQEQYLEDTIEATGHFIEEGSVYALKEGRAQYQRATVEVSGRGGNTYSQALEWQEDDAVTEGRRGSRWVAFMEECREAGYSKATLKSMGRVDESVVNYELLEDLLRYIVEVEPAKVAKGESGWRTGGAILVFLPGLGEIRGILERLRGGRFFRDDNQYWLLPLHSTLSPAEQRKVFERPRHGVRKVILSTNIAETSVTVDDVVYVVDCGLVREIQQTKGRGGGRALVTNWCCRASAKQRMGRAGRVGPGVCFRLFSRHTFRTLMSEFAVPELQRTPLEELCLQIRANDLAPSCREFLLKAPEPPELVAIDAAVRVLREVGALASAEDGAEGRGQQKRKGGDNGRCLEGEEGILTPLGIHLAKLPMDVRLGKMLVFASLFQCLDPVLTVAAGLSGIKSPFLAPFGKEAEARAMHAKLEVRQSDFLTLVNTFQAYRSACLQGGAAEEHKFCSSHFLSKIALREMASLKSQFFGLLVDMQLVRKPPCLGPQGGGTVSYRALEDFMAGPEALRKGGGVNAEAQNINLVLAVVGAGLYPHVAHAVADPSKKNPSLYHGPMSAPSSPVYLHPSSVNYGVTYFTSPWLVFHEKFHTTRAYIAPTSVVSPYALLLFGGPLVVDHLNNRVVIDEWIEFTCPARTAVLFREMRKRLDEVLEVLVAKPLAGLANVESQKEGAVVDAIASLLRGEEIKAAWKPGSGDDPMNKG